MSLVKSCITDAQANPWCKFTQSSTCSRNFSVCHAWQTDSRYMSSRFGRILVWHGQDLTVRECMKLVYCITPALDRYVSLPDRTPHTWTMMSLNICGMAFYNLWHPHSHPSLFLPPSIHFASIWLLPSELTTHGQTHPQLISMKLGYHPWILLCSVTPFGNSWLIPITLGLLNPVYQPRLPQSASQSTLTKSEPMPAVHHNSMHSPSCLTFPTNSLDNPINPRPNTDWLHQLSIGALGIHLHFQFNSNSIPNMGPALWELFLIVSGTQLFKTTIVHLKFK